MSTFGDYKSYKKYQPMYQDWKHNRDLTEAKRVEYLKNNPSIDKEKDIQKAKTLLRAIDVMDEYSQKRAEDMEIATESVVSSVLEGVLTIGAVIGMVIGSTKLAQNLFAKFAKGNEKKIKMISQVSSAVVGAILGTLSAFPLYAWAAKTEVSASKRGRFESMRKELKNPNTFAILTDEQIKEVEKLAYYQNISNSNQKKEKGGIAGSIKYIKNMAFDTKEYKKQKKNFEYELIEANAHINDKMSPEEIEEAKKDQQLLTKLIEKIDIASQDYAENAELAANTFVTGIMAFGALFDILLQKILKACRVKNATKISIISKGLGFVGIIAGSIYTAQISKQASRIGRFKAKQELLKNPEQLIYVDDEKAKNVQNVRVVENKKQGIFEFLKNARKDNKEYNAYKKNEAAKEKRFYKALENIELTDEQIKNAKRLQKNTFRTFNTVDEKSQKYAESVEALGNAIIYPVSLICSGLGIAFGVKFLLKPKQNSLQMAESFAKYMVTIFLSTIPTILLNSVITKEQKKASRIANMMAINEMKDYRQFK